MQKVKELISSLLTIALLIAVGFGLGFHCQQWKSETPAVVTEVPALDLTLPGEAEKHIVTRDEISVALDEVREFATFSGCYTASRVEEVWRCLDDRDLPLTKNTVAVDCQGVVKVGFDVDKIAVEVDEESETVYVRLPAAAVLDNYVIVDTVDASASVNNLLHPLTFEQYQQVLVSVEEEGLAQVTEAGIFEDAETAFKLIVTQFLAGVTDYRIVFL